MEISIPDTYLSYLTTPYTAAESDQVIPSYPRVFSVQYELNALPYNSALLVLKVCTGLYLHSAVSDQHAYSPNTIFIVLYIYLLDSSFLFVYFSNLIGQEFIFFG